MDIQTYRSRAEAMATRQLACGLAAEVMASRPGEQCAPLLHSLAVFFESYITGGARRTARDFGPRTAVRLKLAALPIKDTAP